MLLFVLTNVISLCQNFAKCLFHQAVIDIQLCQDGLAQDGIGIQKPCLESCIFLDEFSQI